jgi:hypothetical protein
MSDKVSMKLIVIYPRPKDVQAFETVYNRDHVPMAVEKLAGKTKIVATRILGSPQGGCVATFGVAGWCRENIAK